MIEKERSATNFNKDKEKTWTYSCQIILNGLKIEQLTITEYFQKHEKHGITKELIRKLVETLNNKEIEPQKGYQGDRKAFVEIARYQGKKYKLVFWFKDRANNHLWVRNCYPVG